MDALLYLTVYTVNAVIRVLMIAMFVRAVTHLFDPMGGSKLYVFLLVITEPIIFPIRAICAKRHWFEGSPIDMPFLFTVILLSLIQTAILSVG